jgi:hypothetical protein
MRGVSTVFALLVFAILGLAVLTIVLTLGKQPKVPPQTIIDSIVSVLSSAKSAQGIPFEQKLYFESGWSISIDYLAKQVNINKNNIVISANSNFYQDMDYVTVRKSGSYIVSACCRNGTCKLGFGRKVSC